MKQLDKFQQLMVYMDYFITQISMKHSFHIFTKKELDMAKYDRITTDVDYPALGVETKYLWKNIPIMTFDQFVESEYGLKEWYWRFEKRIPLA